MADVPRVLPSTRGVARAHMRHYSPLLRGHSVLKENGVYVTVDTPDQIRCNAAQEVYLGGHIYVVSQAVADALTAAGYTVQTLPDPAPETGYLEPVFRIFPLETLYPSADGLYPTV